MAKEVPDLNAAWEKAQAARSGELTEEFNKAADGPETEAEPVENKGPEPDAPKPKTVELSKEFNEASQEGSEMVKQDQPQHNMQPPPDIREPADRQSYNERLSQEQQAALDKAQEIREMKEQAPERVPDLEP